ncbi:hypothetical protein DYD21_15355 [Rhodohalobacter sp. SW132]|uniref:hypothetical protein n=1 Tax=Rhodohalobacter sp. SW132 TaxID=2293433 RepID=UPI000E21DA77|nr:hypothetical protein [Rhodohalobacter sp. SW132]REL29220.1 hypothetical protein DYD21_15355 [Rhodohalobacter sp. SW132]
MKDQSDRLHNHLRDEPQDPLDRYLDKAEKEAISEPDPPVKKNRFRSFILLVLLVGGGFFLIKNTGPGIFSPIFVSSGISTPSISGPSTDLLNRMGSRMEEMGYHGLSHDDLRDLRSDGVTATYISNIRALGYTDLTLSQARALAGAGASSAFVAMMIELGYDLDVDEIISLRRAGVTAQFTSTLHDLGYGDVTKDQLLRMRRIGVTAGLIRELQQQRGEDISMEEIIRYRISNQ